MSQNKTIWKFRLSLVDDQSISMPKGAVFLPTGGSVRDEGPMFLWAIVDPEAPSVERGISIRGTGQFFDLKEEDLYILTVRSHGGALVWHIFDRGER